MSHQRARPDPKAELRDRIDELEDLAEESDLGVYERVLENLRRDSE